LAEVLAVFAFARLVTAIPITPCGAGLVEAALIAGLVGAGGGTSQVAAAVLIYRALTWALPILVGIGCYVWWRRQSWTTRPNALNARPTRHSSGTRPSVMT
jgi:putative heme transporter